MSRKELTEREKGDKTDLSLIHERINRVIYKSEQEPDISAVLIADQVYREMDPNEIAPLEVRFAAIMTLRDMARQDLRGKFRPDVEVERSEQHALFPDLQKRYPVAHIPEEETGTYRQLEYLTTEDAHWNVARLKKAGITILKHSRALQNWCEEQGIWD